MYVCLTVPIYMYSTSSIIIVGLAMFAISSFFPFTVEKEPFRLVELPNFDLCTSVYVARAIARFSICSSSCSFTLEIAS